MATCPAAAFTDHADGVGIIYKQARPVFAADIDNAGQVGDVAAHTEDSVDHDEAGLVLAYPAED